MYELDPRSGHRKVSKYVLSRPKGRAKSELAGAIVCAEAKGPVRFSHWAARGETSWWGYAYEEGEPVGQPLTYPFVRCLATEEGQAGNTYDNVLFMLTEGTIAGEIPGIDAGLTRTFFAGGGEIRPSTASAASKDGGKETFRVADEIHLYVLLEHLRMYQTVDRNLVKRKIAEPWGLDTTTMFRPGESSVAEQLWTLWQTTKAGGKPVKGFVWDHQEGPEPANWKSDRDLKASLKVAYGAAAAWMDLDRIVTEIRSPLTDGADARRYFLNRHAPVTSEGWLKDHPGAWDRCRADVEIPAGHDVAVGVDVSYNRDATAVVIAADVDGRVVLRSKVWTPERGSVIDIDEVMEYLRSVANLYRVRGITYDPAWFRHESMLLADEGLPMVEFPQSPERMTPACGKFLELIVEGTVAHDGDELLRAHVLRAAKRVSERGFTLSKGRSKGHIDACIASALACWELDAANQDLDLTANVW
jgi:phage terminase large subunit-like protein